MIEGEALGITPAMLGLVTTDTGHSARRRPAGFPEQLFPESDFGGREGIGRGYGGESCDQSEREPERRQDLRRTAPRPGLPRCQADAPRQEEEGSQGLHPQADNVQTSLRHASVRLLYHTDLLLCQTGLPSRRLHPSSLLTRRVTGPQAETFRPSLLIHLFSCGHKLRRAILQIGALSTSYKGYILASQTHHTIEGVQFQHRRNERA
jgi:hypothetical protein